MDDLIIQTVDFNLSIASLEPRLKQASPVINESRISRC